MAYAARVTVLLGLLVWLLALVACSSVPTPPPPLTEVQIPVATACPGLADVPPVPETVADTDLKAMNGGQFVIALGADRAALKAWTRTADAAIRACR